MSDRESSTGHPASLRTTGWERWGPLIAVFFASAMILSSFAPVWVDDADASLYRIIVRNIVRTGDLFTLRGLNDVFRVSYEHPPLYFWLLAAVSAVFGEWALPWFGVFVGVGCLFVTYVVGTRILSERTSRRGQNGPCCFGRSATWSAFASLTPPSWWRTSGRSRVGGRSIGVVAGSSPETTRTLDRKVFEVERRTATSTRRDRDSVTERTRLKDHENAAPGS